MRSSGLFWRMFASIMAVILVTVMLFSAMLVTIQSAQARETYETEVRMQARQVAQYMEQLNQLNLVRSNNTIQWLINEKIADIYDRYNADIWLVSYNSNSATIQYMDRSWNTSEGIATEAVSQQLGIVQSGQEIRVTGLFDELGDHIVTIGVPWTYSDGRVVGAVLLHIPNDQLEVHIWETLPVAMFPAGVSLLLGVILAFLVARSQTNPIREIEGAVRAFTRGDLSRRVELHCGGELEQLGHSINRMASELSGLEESRRSFVANVSHELRSPMTSIKGYVEAMLDGTIGDQDRPRYLRVVLSETNRLTDLVRDLLDLSRLESGKFPMHIAPFDANEMMRRILISFEQRISEKGIDVDIRFAADPCCALGDMSRINQVVSNFVDNAVKFMTGEGSVLTLSTVQEDRFVRFIVRDNGPGISEADQPHVLERFYKADKAHTAGMGTGLGLSICKNILQQHSSMIELFSRPGFTEFSFLLPAAEPEPRKIEANPAR
ncbi:MAG: sensor histidine kinase [Clostridia bacterium]|nr:sensor histidine kinase [Clostridia bacterium]